MVTVLCAVLAFCLIAALVGMFAAAMNGCLLSSWWFVFGGAGQLIEFIGQLIAEAIKGICEG